jgi:hypothetical protein
MPTAKKSKGKAEFTRCPHCHLRFGSEESLGAHVNEHIAKVRAQLISPEHRKLLDPTAHHAMLKERLRKGGHGR